MMRTFLYEDEVTELFSNFLEANGWTIVTRAKGMKHGIDINAEKDRKKIFIEAKGGGSQVKSSKRYGQPFTPLQCKIHTDCAFATLARMTQRGNPNFVGMILPDTKCHRTAIEELKPSIKILDAGAWLISKKEITVINEPKNIGKLIY